MSFSRSWIGRTAGVALLALVACLVLAACSSDSKSSPTATAVPALTVDDVSKRGAYGVGVTTLTVVDTSRPTAANGAVPATPDRRMAAEVWYPAAPTAAAPEQRDVPLERSGAAYPLIIFAHGFSSFRRQSAQYTQQLASHGYIVASPDFPQSRIDTPGGPRLSAVLDQPADVSFVIDRLLEQNAASDGTFAGAIDESRIGMTGHSLGGLTTMLTAFGKQRDPRIKAIVPISPVGCFLPDDFSAGVSVPIMVVGGSKELIVDPVASIKHAYDVIGPPKYRVEVIGADHTRFADVDITDEKLGDIVPTLSGGDVVADAIKIGETIGGTPAKCLDRTPSSDELISGERQRDLLRIVALPFFDAYLRQDPASLRFVQETLPTLPGIRFEQD